MEDTRPQALYLLLLGGRCLGQSLHLLGGAQHQRPPESLCERVVTTREVVVAVGAIPGSDVSISVLGRARTGSSPLQSFLFVASSGQPRHGASESVKVSVILVVNMTVMTSSTSQGFVRPSRRVNLPDRNKIVKNEN